MPVKDREFVDFPEFEGQEDSEIFEEASNTQPKKEVGIFGYRRHLLALKHLERRLAELKAYRESVITDIDEEIGKRVEQGNGIKDILKEAILADDSIVRTKTGGKSIKLPDIATVSVTKPKEVIDIIDKEAMVARLKKGGVIDDYLEKEVVEKLNIAKIKKMLLATNEDLAGTVRAWRQDLRVRFR